MSHSASPLQRHAAVLISAIYDRIGTLRIRDLRVIASVALKGGISQADVSRETGIHKVAVTRSATRLQRSGLISVRKVQDDGRLTAMHITKRGEAFLETLSAAQTEAYEAFLDRTHELADEAARPAA